MIRVYKTQRGFADILLILLVVLILVVALVAYRITKQHSKGVQNTATVVKTSKPMAAVVPEVSWHLGEGNIWVSSGTPPACPAQPLLSTPVDMSLVSSILYPGQVRGNAFKPQGGFRFDKQPNNNITVTVPMDAKLVRGSKGLFAENGEVQYGFEFIAPCGIWYSFGHIHTLSPQFQAYADKLPLVSDHSQQQIVDINPTPEVKSGDVIATQVGIVKTKNVFVELAVLDLRHKNGFTIRPSWAKYSNEFDEHGVCWLDWLPSKDQAPAKALPGGDSVGGKQSDYCK